MLVDITAFGHRACERDVIVADAEASLGRTPEERYAMFCSLQRMIAVIWGSLSEDERRRRLEIGEKLEPRPEPWWRNIKPEGLR